MGTSIPPYGKALALFFLLAFTALFITQNVNFINLDTSSKDYDGKYTMALAYYDRLAAGATDFLNLPFSKPSELQHPPLVFLITLPFFALGGATLEVARHSISVFSAVFLLSMFGIGLELGGFLGAATVMALAASSPSTLNGSRGYLLDFPQAAVTALAFYLLLRSDFFRNRTFCVIGGAAAGAAILTKWSSIFFLALPVIWLAAPGVLRSRRSFLVALAGLIPLAVTVVGLLRFYSGFGPETPKMMWVQSWVEYVGIPHLAWLVLCPFLERAVRRRSPDLLPEVGAAMNLSLYLSVCTVITTPWFFWAAKGILQGLIASLVCGLREPTFAGIADSLLLFYGRMFTLVPLFLGCGLICLILLGADRYRLLLLPANLAVGTLIFLYIGFSSHSYFTALVIFGAALGGWWVGSLRRPLGPFVTAWVLVMSILSMLAWTAIPGRCALYNQETDLRSETLRLRPSPDWLKMLRSSPPTEADFDLQPLIARIEASPDKEIPVVVNYAPPGYPWREAYMPGPEYIESEARKQGKRIRVIRILGDGNAGKEFLKCVDACALPRLRDILVFRLAPHSPDKAVQSLAREVPFRIASAKTLRLNRERTVTHIVLRL